MVKTAGATLIGSSLSGVNVGIWIIQKHNKHLVLRYLPEWRNWQTRWIQNPVSFTDVRVRVPPLVLFQQRTYNDRVASPFFTEHYTCAAYWRRSFDDSHVATSIRPVKQHSPILSASIRPSTVLEPLVR